jgi:hypothetical protein
LGFVFFRRAVVPAGHHSPPDALASAGGLNNSVAAETQHDCPRT